MERVSVRVKVVPNQMVVTMDHLLFVLAKNKGLQLGRVLGGLEKEERMREEGLILRNLTFNHKLYFKISKGKPPIFFLIDRLKAHWRSPREHPQRQDQTFV